MFWGITLESGKKYTQILQRSFCVTMAALGFENPSNDTVYVVAEVNGAQHVLCSLRAGIIPQQALNLNFTEGEHVSFFIEGEGQVHLTGYLTPLEEDSDLSDESSCDEDEGHTRRTSEIHTHENGNGEVSDISHTHENGTGEVSDISWSEMLSGNHATSNKSNNQDTTYNISVANGLKDSHNEDIFIDSNDTSCIYTPIPIDSSNSDLKHEITSSSNDSGTRNSLVEQDVNHAHVKDKEPTSKKKKKTDAKKEIGEDRCSSSEDSDSRYMLAEKDDDDEEEDTKPLKFLKRKRSNSVKSNTSVKVNTSVKSNTSVKGKTSVKSNTSVKGNTRTSTRTVSKKSENMKKLDKTVQKKAKSKLETKKVTGTKQKNLQVKPQSKNSKSSGSTKSQKRKK